MDTEDSAFVAHDVPQSMNRQYAGPARMKRSPPFYLALMLCVAILSCFNSTGEDEEPLGALDAMRKSFHYEQSARLSRTLQEEYEAYTGYLRSLDRLSAEMQSPRDGPVADAIAAERSEAVRKLETLAPLVEKYRDSGTDDSSAVGLRMGPGEENAVRGNIYKFVAEWPDQKIDLRRLNVPDELYVKTRLGTLTLSGVANVDTATIHGSICGHFGKIILFRDSDLGGELLPFSPQTLDGTTYHIVIEMTNGLLKTQPINLSSGTGYTWACRKADSQVSLTVASDYEPLQQLAVSNDVFAGFGFGATVRRPGDRAALKVDFMKRIPESVPWADR